LANGRRALAATLLLRLVSLLLVLLLLGLLRLEGARLLGLEGLGLLILLLLLLLRLRLGLEGSLGLRVPRGLLLLLGQLLVVPGQLRHGASGFTPTFVQGHAVHTKPGVAG
jgi:hypothetical protein